MSWCGLSCRWVVVCSMWVPAVASAQPSGPADTADPPAAAHDAAPQPELHLNVGMGYARRAFDYDLSGSSTRSVPPAIRSAAPELQIDGDIYPFALADRKSPVADLGFAMTYAQVVGSTVQTQSSERNIDQSYFSVGPRYRFHLDAHSSIKPRRHSAALPPGDKPRSSIAVGLDFVRQQYIVEHAAFQAQLPGVPDITYSAIAPTVTGRFAVAPDTMLLAQLAGWFVVDAGQITDLDQYGKSRVLGLTAMAGTEFALTPRINLSILFQYSRVSLDFDGVGQMSTNAVGATDETVGVVAALGMQY